MKKQVKTILCSTEVVRIQRCNEGLDYAAKECFREWFMLMRGRLNLSVRCRAPLCIDSIVM